MYLPSQTDVHWSFVFIGCYRKEGHDTAIQTNTAKAAEGSTEDENVHLVGRTTDSRANLEQEDRNQIEQFSVELGVHLAPGKLLDSRRF